MREPALRVRQSPMRKTFQLAVDGKHPDRLMDAIKHEISKYLKRERARTLPAGVDFWDFDCKLGLTAQEAQPLHLAELKSKMDQARAGGASQLYVEVLAKHGVRTKKPGGGQHIF